MLQPTFFLSLLVSGHVTICLTRNQAWLWERPRPTWKLAVPGEPTPFLGTLIVVYGIAMTPTGWALALFLGGYTLVSVTVANVVKIAACRPIGHLVPSDRRRLARVEGHVIGLNGTDFVSSLFEECHVESHHRICALRPAERA